MKPQQAGGFEKWAARAWNVVNEGRPFSIVYPVMVLVAAWLVGIAPAGSIGVALLGEHVALMGLTPERLRALPAFAPGSATAVQPDETLRLGIVRPFH